MSASLIAQADELCMDGTLLFREDFGGNDPDDPVAGTNPAPGMTSSYTQIYDTATCILQRPCTGMGSGRYLLTKIGYRNAASYTYSHWFIMDDHTYPNDYTRGYLLEIDGRTDNATLFETVIDGLCEGTKLTFSAYVVNLTTSYSYDHGNNGDPQLSFVLQDPETGAQLTTPYKTGPIPVDRSYQGMSGEWRNSAHWNLVGMNFTVPPGRTAIKLIIKNACTAANGNDFAMDDIEIRLCAPPVTIDGEPEVCADDATTLTANFTNDGTFPEPLEYKWWFSEDSLTWTELNKASPTLAIPAMHETNAGWYKVAVSGVGNIGSVNCRAQSEPFRLNIKECTPPELEPELCMDGILLFREDFGGNDPADPKISTTAVPGMSYTQVKTDALGSMGAGKYLVTKQGYKNGTNSSQWHIQDDHTYPNDYTRGYFMEIDGRAGSDAFYQTTIDHLCEGIELTFSAYVANVMTWGMYMGRPGTYAYPRLKFVLTNHTDNSELATYDTGDIPFDSTFINDNACWRQSAKWNLVGMNFTVPMGVEAVQLSIYNNVSNFNGNDFALDDIEIRLCMTPDTIRTDTVVCDTINQILWRDRLYNMDDILRDTLRSNCGFDSIYYVLNVATEHCCPALRTVSSDTLVCDTLMPYRWRDTLFTEPMTYEILYKDIRGCDSLLSVLTLGTQTCCPYMIRGQENRTICDTLMPYVWHGFGETVVIEEEGEHLIEIPSERWPDCIAYHINVILTVEHCERKMIYPLIVNKYNWQLLLDNVTLRRLFPDRTATAYQWYKDEQPIPGANDDDYSEQNELHGYFQLRIVLDNKQTIWSNILEINVDQPTTDDAQQVRIFNSRGMPVLDGQLTRGIYLYRFEQGDKVWTEKRLIP